jgi:hypothetical protein
LPAAFVSIDEIKKQIEENQSLRFDSAPIWNTFLQPYCQTGVAKRGATDLFCEIFAWSVSGRRSLGCAFTECGGFSEWPSHLLKLFSSSFHPVFVVA